MRWFRELFSGAPVADQATADSWVAMQIRAVTIGILLLCILATLVVSMIAADSSWGIVFVFATALIFAGYIVGLLFSLPRVLSNAGDAASGDDAATQPAKRLYSINTNLEQISDWLTKIIVGVGLVEASRIQSFVVHAAQYLGGAISGQPHAMQAGPATVLSLAIILVYPSLGFLLGFFSVRLYISRALYVADVAILRPVDISRVLNSAAAQLPPAEAPGQAERVAAAGPEEFGAQLHALGLERANVSRNLALPTDQDPVLQLAAVRISIERELRRLCMIARVIDAKRATSFSEMLRSMRTHELLEPGIESALRQIYNVASAALHGRSVIQNEADDINAAGQQLIDRLHALPSDPLWFERAIRARASGQSVTVPPVAGRDSGVDLIVNDVPIIIKVQYRPDRAIFANDSAVIVLSTPPRQTQMPEMLKHAVVWLDESLLRGTQAASERAAWLVDAPA
jgi:hypothetical protein